MSAAGTAHVQLAAVARPAATVLVVRESPNSDLEVLLLQRAAAPNYTGGAWVFPGGVVDESDRQLHTYCQELGDAEASRRLGLASGGLDYYAAALRECFEETGLLFGEIERDDGGRTISPSAAMRSAWRLENRRKPSGFAALCNQHAIKMHAAQLTYIAHWITPLPLPKRFDTRFFVAVAPANQEALHDGEEIVEHRWIAPAAALAVGSNLHLLTATRSVLGDIAPFNSVAALLQWASSRSNVPTILPRMATASDGKQSVLPSDAAWAEIGLLDPGATGAASCEIKPGVAVRLSERVIRLTAPNAGLMTGPGTNSYLVGSSARNEWAVIDPGPADSAHVEALTAAAPGVIRWILVTHTHRDHSPAASLMHARTGAEVIGIRPAYSDWQDGTFVAKRSLADGECLQVAEDIVIRAVHTPGHASNHVCYLLERERMLFTGDHVIQGSTVVINPPDGDMSAYLASLHKLLDLDLEWLAPGHGFLIAEPKRAIKWLIGHREQREAKILNTLTQAESIDMATLVARVYDDVPASRHALAERSLLAHLLRLESQDRAHNHGNCWSL
jgi:glyoxylase-like metal-dependent hydrolase (beta-lactamase superfamily II)/8-oxo-dGTP pyrophosphatase MutT (NUDIX family)